MYELFKSNEQDESILLIKADIKSLEEAMQALRECDKQHCQIEKFGIPDEILKDMKKLNFLRYVEYMAIYGRYTLIATKHNGKITKYY